MKPSFIPPRPPRRPMPVASWRGFFGERARTAVYGWSQFAFETDHIKRRILGYTVHVLLDPDMVQHVLLDHPAKYAKPDIVKSILDPIIGRGLLTSDGDLWRAQRRIVAASFSPAAVDAPLDDANVERFCDLLDRMTAETDTRYLIVTHNAVTMSRMHRLYGVTMIERGVSRLVSVDLGGAEELLAAE